MFHEILSKGGVISYGETCLHLWSGNLGGKRVNQISLDACEFGQQNAKVLSHMLSQPIFRNISLVKSNHDHLTDYLTR